MQVKPEYQNELMDQLDLVMLGGYWGCGRDGGKLSHFLLGVSDRGVNQPSRRFTVPDEDLYFLLGACSCLLWVL